MLLIRGAQVYSPEPIGARDVLVAGREVVAIDERLEPRGVEVEEIDASGLLLVPGLVDAHAHLGGGGGEGGAHTRVPAVSLSRLTTAGVTTAIGLLGTDCSTRSMADLLAAARGLEALGLSTFCYTGGYTVPPTTLTGSARGDIVHVDRIVAIGETAISDHRSSQPNFDEIARLAADAHVAGMMTGKAGLLHLHLGDGPRGLDLVRRALRETELPARTFHPTHVNRNRALWAEAMALEACPVDVSAFPPDGATPEAGECIASWHHAGRDMRRITMSSDAGGCIPTFDASGVLLGMEVGSAATLLPEVFRAYQLGVPLSLALATCTASVAELFRLHRKGRVAVGADADLLLLDPSLGVRGVLAGGRWLVKDGAPLVRGPFEAS
ncbi:MAG: beta-aspartyl-peptidase [Deltaproteobacteria bacterium]|nr:beta-aspartyl-peptidase [Deltaproteobacteria bacterium]